jgi:predicted transcriptional regulator
MDKEEGLGPMTKGERRGMRPPNGSSSIDYSSIAGKADPRILSLFPTLAGGRGRDTTIRSLACLYAVGKNGPTSIRGLSKALNMPYSRLKGSLEKLSSLSLVEITKNGRTLNYSLTTKGIVALVSFEDFRSFTSIKFSLSNYKNKGNRLAYVLLLIGYGVSDKPNIIHEILVKYAEQGHNLEPLNNDASAESILNFYGDELKSQAKSPPNYLNMFKEFTTAGVQDVLRMLLAAMRPTPEGYSWLIEFFHELVEFYYDPVRTAYMNILSQNPEFRRRLDGFKATQEQRMRTEGSRMELTFIVPRGPLLQRFMSMPPHLRVMGMRLMLEPLQFMAQELNSFFYS